MEFETWQTGTVFPAQIDDDETDPVASGPPTQGPLRGPSARAYLVMVIGEYALDQGDSAWTQTLVDALALVGFGEKAVRQALTRSAAAGWVTPERNGRRVRWRITDEGRRMLRSGKARIFATAPSRDWNGDWLVLLTSVPETNRRLRHRLRTSLSWAGFGSPAPGVWISPNAPGREADELRPMLRGFGDQLQSTLLLARFDDPAERDRLIAQAWDIAALDEKYRAFIERFSAAEPYEQGDTLAQQLHMMYEWRRLLLLDPGLPASLLPRDWSGEHARRLFLDRHRAWRRPGLAWWRRREKTRP